MCFSGEQADYRPLDFMQQEMGSENIPKRIESSDLNRYLYTNVHNSIIYNSQKMEITHMSTDEWWMEKENVTYTYNGILFRLKKNEILRHATTRVNLETLF